MCQSPVLRKDARAPLTAVGGMVVRTGALVIR